MSRTLKVILIVGIALMLGGGLFYGAAYALGDKYINKNTGDYSETFNQVSDISDFKLDASVAKVNIKLGAANEIKIDAQDIITENLDCGIRNNTFEVFYETKWTNWSIISIPGITNNRSTPVIDIYIPESMMFDNFSIDSGVGEYNIEGDIGEMNINTGVGVVKVSGSISRDIKIDSGVGEVKLDLAGDINNYDVRSDSGVGSVNINGEQASNYGNSSAPYKLDISGGVGNISVNITQYADTEPVTTIIIDEN